MCLSVIRSDTSHPTTKACIARCQRCNESGKPDCSSQNAAVLNDVPLGLARRVLGSYTCPMGQDPSGIDGTLGEQKVAPPPSQADLDSLFDAACAARIFSGGTSGKPPKDSSLLQVLRGEPLQTLRRALHLTSQQEPRSCSCFGDLTIELTGDSGSVAVLSLHYHPTPLLRYSGWSYDAELGDRHQLFAQLTACGLAPALQKVEADLQQDERESERRQIQRWLSGNGRIHVGDIMMAASKKEPA